MRELNTIQLESLFKLILAVCLGGAVGLEREFHRQDAGFRTHILVCLGSTVIMIASQRVYQAFSGVSEGNLVQIDPGRIAAGIVTGIGFLGAGAIFRSAEMVRGLTTAACIWLVAGLGIAIGEGLYVLSVEATALAVFVLLVLRRLERCFKPGKQMSIVLALKRGEGSMSSAESLLSDRGAQVAVSSIRENVQKNERTVELKVRFTHKPNAEELVSALAELPGVNTVSWG